MGDNLALAGVLQPVTSGEDVIFDIIKGIVEFGFQEAVAMAEDIADAVWVRYADMIGCYANEITVGLVLLVDRE